MNRLTVQWWVLNFTLSVRVALSQHHQCVPVMEFGFQTHKSMSVKLKVKQLYVHSGVENSLCFCVSPCSWNWSWNICGLIIHLLIYRQPTKQPWWPKCFNKNHCWFYNRILFVCFSISVCNCLYHKTFHLPTKKQNICRGWPTSGRSHLRYYWSGLCSHWPGQKGNRAHC